MIRDENLDFWLQNQYNVLFVGHAGVGKTSIVKAAFEKHNLNHRYFSASTMDPWVDLVGVPKERIDDATGETYLDLIRPKGLDQVEAFFFDEFNRSHKKVRNACMELLQFKSINGRVFPNLKVVWAAINPDDDDTYDVEKLDPAQKDRFHIQVPIPYKPDSAYFTQKYGQMTARSAISWWNDLSEEIRFTVSPRRLDYALDVLSKDGDIRFVLPQESNVSKLLTTIQHGPIQDMLEKLYKSRDAEESKKWLSAENTYQAAVEYIIKSEPKSRFFLPLVSQERLATLAADTSMLRFLLKFCSESEAFATTLANIYEAGQNKKAVEEIKKAIAKDRGVAEALGYDSKAGYRTWPMGTDPQSPHFNKDGCPNFAAKIAEFAKRAKASAGALTTVERKKMYEYAVASIPAKLTVEESLATLKMFDGIVRRSQYTTVQKLDKLTPMINHCFEQIHKNTGLTVPQIAKRFSGNQFPELWKRLREDKGLSSQIIPYGQEQEAA